MIEKGNTTKEPKRKSAKKVEDVRQLVIRLQNDPVAMRQARKLIAAI